MNEDNIMKFERDPDNPPTLTPAQRARLEAMTDADVKAAACADPDAQPLTDEQLAQFERVPNVKASAKSCTLSIQFVKLLVYRCQSYAIGSKADSCQIVPRVRC